MNDYPRTSRREFLKGKAAVDALGEVVRRTDGVESADADPQQVGAVEFSPRDAYLVSVSRPAMACDFTIYQNAGQYPLGTDAALEALDLVDALEDQLTVYRDESQLVEINRRAAEGPVAVEARLFDLLEQAMVLFEETDGAFDITTGPLSVAWGFFRRAGRVPSHEQLAEAHARVGSQYVRLDAASQSVSFLKPGIELNVNSIGKGYALDRGAELLQRAGVDDFLFHGGQSSVLAHGSHAQARAGGWTVGLRHPLRPERRLAEFYLRDRALGTSGSGTQFFHYQGRRLAHVLDPRTGHPAEGTLSSTVLAPTAAEADALATAFFVMGPERARAYCQHHAEIAMLLVCSGPREGTIGVHRHGLDDCDWQPLDDLANLGKENG